VRPGLEERSEGRLERSNSIISLTHIANNLSLVASLLRGINTEKVNEQSRDGFNFFFDSNGEKRYYRTTLFLSQDNKFKQAQQQILAEGARRKVKNERERNKNKNKKKETRSMKRRGDDDDEWWTRFRF